jgi:AcrR family transcriptional regulator
MQEWVPWSTSTKGRLVRAALEAFGREGYDAVHVGALAAAAGTTTGPLYHHFGSKLGLYGFVRADVEQRVVDRLEGALAAGVHLEADDVLAALLVAFDYAERAGFARMLSEPHPSGGPDPVAEVLDDGATPLGAMLAAAWRAALAAVADGAEPESARAALRAFGAARSPAQGRRRARRPRCRARGRGRTGARSSCRRAASRPCGRPSR